MLNNICTEIAQFRVLSDISEERFVKIIEQLEHNFHSKQSGFISTVLTKDKEEWIMVQQWNSSEQAHEASKKMMKDTVTEDFRNALDPRSVKIRYLPCMLSVTK